MGLENSKLQSYGFHPISAKVYEGLSYHGGIQAIKLISWHSVTCYKKCGTLKFYCGSEWKIVK